MFLVLLALAVIAALYIIQLKIRLPNAVADRSSQSGRSATEPHAMTPADLSEFIARDEPIVAILALPVAFAVFAVDKIRDLTQPWERLAIAFLCLSGLGASVGYAWGVFVRGGRHGVQDGMIPRRFLQDYSTRGAVAIVDTIRAVTAAGEQNGGIRLTKRIFAGSALLLFIAGALTVFVARLGSAEPQPGPTPCTARCAGPTGR